MKKKIIVKPPRINMEIGEQKITGYAGGVLIHNLAHRLKLPQLIEKHVHVKKRARGYEESEVIMALCENLALGGDCLDDLEGPRHDTALMEAISVEAIPDPTTAGRFLDRFTVGHLKQLHSVNREVLARAHRKRPMDTATIFFDSSIFVAYGKQKEGVEGTWKKTRGYHPLLAILEESEEWLHARLRRGGAYTARGAVSFIKESLSMLPCTVKQARARLDAGFYSEEICQTLESWKGGPVEYTMTAEQTAPLRERLMMLQANSAIWSPVAGTNMEVASMIFRPSTWRKERRFIVYREPIPEGEQLNLWDAPDYRFRAIVTNSNAPDEAIVKAHWKAFDGENRIRQIKHHAGLSHIPPANFEAAAAYFLIGQLAYNLMVWLKRLALPKEYLIAGLKKIRDRFLRVAVLLVHGARQIRMRLSAGNRFGSEFIAAYEAIMDL